jgi:hypothetical protein
VNTKTQKPTWRKIIFNDWDSATKFLNDNNLTPANTQISGYSTHRYTENSFLEIVIIYFGSNPKLFLKKTSDNDPEKKA